MKPVFADAIMIVLLRARPEIRWRRRAISAVSETLRVERVLGVTEVKLE